MAGWKPALRISRTLKPCATKPYERPAHRPLRAHHGGRLLRSRQDRREGYLRDRHPPAAGQSQLRACGGPAANRRLPFEPELHGRRGGLSSRPAAVPRRHAGLLRVSAGVPFHGRPLRGSRGHAAVCGRAGAGHSGAHRGSADSGDLRALRVHVSVADRLEGGAHGGSRGRPSGGGVRHAPRAHPRSGRAGRARRVPGGLRREPATRWRACATEFP